ncbi:hypothetical protein Agub_g14884, partial [Astrephomene gubernaculifera]
ISMSAVALEVSGSCIERFRDALGNIVTVDPVVGAAIQSTRPLARLSQLSYVQLHTDGLANVVVEPTDRFIELGPHDVRILPNPPVNDNPNVANLAPTLMVPYGTFTEYVGNGETYKKVDAMIAVQDVSGPVPLPFKVSLKARAAALPSAMERLLQSAASQQLPLYANGFHERKNPTYGGTMWINNTYFFGAPVTRRVQPFLERANAAIAAAGNPVPVAWTSRLAQEWDATIESALPQDGVMENASVQPLIVRPVLGEAHVFPMALTHQGRHYAVYADTLDVLRHVPGYVQEFGDVDISEVPQRSLSRFLQEPFDLHVDVDIRTIDRHTRIVRMTPR